MMLRRKLVAWLLSAPGLLCAAELLLAGLRSLRAELLVITGAVAFEGVRRCGLDRARARNPSSSRRRTVPAGAGGFLHRARRSANCHRIVALACGAPRDWRQHRKKTRPRRAPCTAHKTAQQQQQQRPRLSTADARCLGLTRI